MLREELDHLLRHGSPRVRFAAAFVLARREPLGIKLLPALLEALELDDSDARWEAARMLVALGRTQREVLPVLLHEASQASAPGRRRMALYAARELGPDRPETLRALLRLLEDSDPGVRRAALSSLGKVVDPDVACLDRVIQVLAADDDPRMRRIAAVLLPDLARCGPDSAQRARVALRHARQEADGALQRAASVALERLGDPASSGGARNRE